MTLPNTVTCADGRELGLREIGPAEMLDLIEAAGSAAGSDAWMRYAVMICSVAAIDGKPVIMPTTKNAVRELGRRVGNEGVEALATVFYPVAEAGDQMSEETETEVESIKN